jgi:hypothetical protein
VGKVVLGFVLISFFACACRNPKPLAKVHPQSETNLSPLANTEAKNQDPILQRTKDQSIADGLRYLSKVNPTWDLAYLYTYLQPKFQWPDLPMQSKIESIQDSLKNVGDTPSLRVLDQMISFKRLIDPTFVLPHRLLQSAEEEDAFTLIALYCDQLKPDSGTFFPILRQEMVTGDYRLTHALLAYVWLTEHQCFSAEDMQFLRDELISSNYSLVARFPDWIDLKIESAALLQASGEELPVVWVKDLIRAQQVDGGWRKDMHQSQSEGHATLLALWLLAGSN